MEGKTMKKVMVCAKTIGGIHSPQECLVWVACLLDAVTSSGILKAKQKLGATFNFDKQDVIDFQKLRFKKKWYFVTKIVLTYCEKNLS